MSVSSTPGARESNAGDDFHILWAARRTVQLLNPRSNLFRVIMEGVSPSDVKSTSDYEDLFLGVDLTEYYGGNDFVTSTSIVTSQLKYSTRHPNKEWTVSRLCEAKNKNKTDSVIKRLADIYKGFVTSNSREDVIQKLSIRLVSNQPLANDLQVALKSAQDFLVEQRYNFTPSMIREEDKIIEIRNKAVYARPAASPDRSRWAKEPEILFGS